MARLILSSSAYLFWFLGVVITANAAEKTLHHVTPVDLELITWGFIAFFTTLGWASAELDVMVLSFLNVEAQPLPEVWRNRLSHIRSLVASELAGIGSYFLGYAAPQYFGFSDKPIPEMLLLLIAAGGGYGGTKTLQWVMNKFFAGRPDVVVAQPPNSP